MCTVFSQITLVAKIFEVLKNESPRVGGSSYVDVRTFGAKTSLFLNLSSVHTDKGDGVPVQAWGEGVNFVRTSFMDDP